MPMKVCRFLAGDNAVRVGWVDEDETIADLTPAGISTLSNVLESPDPIGLLKAIDRKPLPRHRLADVVLRAPIERQEVWAAGVTYLRSKTARMEESDFSATAYDRVYDADRPEIFFKALAEKVVPTGEAVGIRRDARWSVPEPELALVISSKGTIVGCTIGNDMSSRDIEGENLLYLPQAKVYDRSCALGPWINLGVTEADARDWTVRSTIVRGGAAVFSGETRLGNIKRRFDELAAYLCRSQSFPYGAVLLTGTGIVPPDDFTLHEHDVVQIEIAPIGVLRNSVVTV
jgi:2-dehydro-3-deoxy-D-arabinonate dehydratase